MKKIVLLTLSIIAAVSVFSFVKQNVNNVEMKDMISENPSPPQYKCYEAMPVEVKEPTVDQLKEQIEKLDDLYADKKIDKTTYKTRKLDLLKKIENFNK